MRIRASLCLVITAIAVAGLFSTNLPSAAAVDPVTLGTATHAVNGCDVPRKKGALVIYTPAKGASTGTNQWGFEAAVVGGIVTKISDRTGNMAIPADGVVLSGNGTSRTWLKAHAYVGQTAVIPNCGAAAPTQMLPDLGMRGIRDVSLDTTSTPGVRKLRFTTIIVNAGKGNMEVVGRRSDTTSEMTTQQRVYNSDGTTSLRDTAAKMYFAGDGHSHWHVRDLERFDLHRLSDGVKVRSQAKHGFCFFDGSLYTSSKPAYYTTCGRDAAALTQTMGLSPGWGDRYGATLPDQYIDVTNLPTGTYRLFLKADADNWFIESNETNNGNWADIEITDTTATVTQQGGAIF